MLFMRHNDTYRCISALNPPTSDEIIVAVCEMSSSDSESREIFRRTFTASAKNAANETVQEQVAFAEQEGFTFYKRKIFMSPDFIKGNF